jgi:hypothetical protein
VPSWRSGHRTGGGADRTVPVSRPPPRADVVSHRAGGSNRADVPHCDSHSAERPDRFRPSAFRFVTLPTVDLTVIGRAVNHLAIALSAGDTCVTETLNRIAGPRPAHTVNIPPGSTAADVSVHVARSQSPSGNGRSISPSTTPPAGPTPPDPGP